jgi:hypothetical protein
VVSGDARPPAASDPSALSASRGTVAVAAGPIGEGMADGDTSESEGDMARITATEPPAAASASADAASARLDLVSTGERLEPAECLLGGFRLRLARGNYALVTMSQPDSVPVG